MGRVIFTWNKCGAWVIIKNIISIFISLSLQVFIIIFHKQIFLWNTNIIISVNIIYYMNNNEIKNVGKSDNSNNSFIKDLEAIKTDDIGIKKMLNELKK